MLIMLTIQFVPQRDAKNERKVHLLGRSEVVKVGGLNAQDWQNWKKTLSTGASVVAGSLAWKVRKGKG